MAKMINQKTLSLLLAFMASGGALAQQEETPPGSEDTDTELPADFIHKGQVVPVAEEGIELADDQDDLQTVPEFNQEQDDATRLLGEFDLFKQLMADNVLDEADTVAKRVVELAIKTHGPQSNEFAKALTNLAIVQYRTEQFDASIHNFESAIGIIEDNEDRLNAQLINPLKGLGAAQLEFGRPDLASKTFQRAVHVSHVNEGPHNLDQIELLESIAETYARMGEMDAAKDAQDTIYALNIRKHELDSLGLVPSLMRRAEWQHRAGFIFDERATYRRVIRIIEDNDGKASIALVEPLIKLGRSYFYVDMSGQTSFHDGGLASGEIYFRRASRIATESPDSNWDRVAYANLALGDFYMYAGNPQRGGQVYGETWQLLSSGEEQLNVRRMQLEKVVALKKNRLPVYYDSGEDAEESEEENPALQGNVSFTYGVSAKGRATNVQLVSLQPPELERMAATVQRELRRRIYRPRLVEGEVADTTDLTLDHRFYYRQTDVDAAIAKAKAEAKDK